MVLIVVAVWFLLIYFCGSDSQPGSKAFPWRYASPHQVHRGQRSFFISGGSSLFLNRLYIYIRISYIYGFWQCFKLRPLGEASRASREASRAVLMARIDSDPCLLLLTPPSWERYSRWTFEGRDEGRGGALLLFCWQRHSPFSPCDFCTKDQFLYLQ